jgi:glycosyltransferase involved in cell wall biosynthesis
VTATTWCGEAAPVHLFDQNHPSDLRAIISVAFDRLSSDCASQYHRNQPLCPRRPDCAHGKHSLVSAGGEILPRISDLLHQNLWQRLPRSWRRPALYHATALWARRPTPGVVGREPIFVAGAFKTCSGLGESARLCHDALRVGGFRVVGVDLSAGLMQPSDFADFPDLNCNGAVGCGTLIVHVNGPLMPLAMMRLGKRVVENKRVIGYWSWELPKVPKEWQIGVQFVHEIWVPSQFTARAVMGIADGRPIRVVPHPLAVRALPSGLTLRSPAKPFTVLAIFNPASSVARKNPLAAIRAFLAAFGDDPSARLIIQGSNLPGFPQAYKNILAASAGRHNISVLVGTRTAQGIAGLYSNADVVLSLHRSEGFGLVIGEAMLHGLPVLATNWSGNVDFLTSENGVPIGYALVPAVDRQKIYDHPDLEWAEPDLSEAAQKLHALREDKEWRQRVGERASADAKRLFSTEVYCKRVAEALGVWPKGVPWT